MADFTQNPYLQMGLGILGGNTGPNAFNNAMAGGLGALQQYNETMIPNQLAAQRLQMEQAALAAQQQEQQRKLQAEEAARIEAERKAAAQAQYWATQPEPLQRYAEHFPQQAAKLQAERLSPVSMSPKVVGDALVDPSTGRVIYRQPQGTQALQPGDRFKMERALAGDFDKSSSAFQEISEAWTTINAIPDSAIGEIALTTKIMKMLDPGSVVRESELGMAIGTTGLFQRFENLARKAQTGQGLSPQQKKEFKTLARKIYVASQKQFKRIKGKYTRQAKEYGLKPENVTFDYSSQTDQEERVNSLLEKARRGQ